MILWVPKVQPQTPDSRLKLFEQSHIDEVAGEHAMQKHPGDKQLHKQFCILEW